MNNEEKKLPRSKVFLGGSCTSNWRDKIIPALDYYEVNYFNPVVKEWTPEAAKLEEDEKNHKCDIHLYYFDNTMTGMYSMAEMMKSCMDIECRGYDDEDESFYKTRFVKLVLMIVNTDGMTESQIKSFDASYSLASDVTKYIYYRDMKDDSELNGEFAEDLLGFCNSIKYSWESDDYDEDDED